jgi:hypothetical protein
MENDSRGRGAENIYEGCEVESRKKYGLKRRGKIKYNAVRRGRSTLIAALLQDGRGVFGCRWRRGLWIWGLLMDYNIAPLRSVVLRSSGPVVHQEREALAPAPDCANPLRIPAHLLYPQGRETPGCPPDCLGGCTSATRQWLIRLDCGAMRCRCCSMLLDAAPQPALERKRPHSFCSQLESARVAFAFRRPSLPSSPSLTSIALPALGTPLDCVWLEGSLGADVQGSDRGIAHHWGPCPADCPVKQRCGPGVQESSPQQRARCVCQPAPSSAAIAPSHTRTLAQSRQPRTAGSEMDCVAPCPQIMGGFRGLPEHVPSRARTLGSRSAEALTGKLAQIHSSESSNV